MMSAQKRDDGKKVKTASWEKAAQMEIDSYDGWLKKQRAPKDKAPHEKPPVDDFEAWIGKRVSQKIREDKATTE